MRRHDVGSGQKFADEEIQLLLSIDDRDCFNGKPKWDGHEMAWENPKQDEIVIWKFHRRSSKGDLERFWKG
jgi:hypothetical protein